MLSMEGRFYTSVLELYLQWFGSLLSFVTPSSKVIQKRIIANLYNYSK